MIAAAEAHFAAHKIQLKTDANAKFAATIPVYWHVIQASTALKDGNVPDSQITAQMNVLNEFYNPTGIYFSLAGTDHTTNADWFKTLGPDSSSQTTAKKQLRKGGANALNLYSVGFQSGSGAGLLGYSTFPSSSAKCPQALPGTFG